MRARTGSERGDTTCKEVRAITGRPRDCRVSTPPRRARRASRGFGGCGGGASGCTAGDRPQPLALPRPWACKDSKVVWSVWSRACFVVRATPSARSSSAADSSERWTTIVRSTSRASASCPTTSPCCSQPPTTQASPTSRTRCVTELVEAVREYAREEGYHFMGPVSRRTPGRQRTAGRSLRHRIAAQAGRARQAARHDRDAVRRPDRTHRRRDT